MEASGYTCYYQTLCSNQYIQTTITAIIFNIIIIIVAVIIISISSSISIIVTIIIIIAVAFVNLIYHPLSSLL